MDVNTLNLSVDKLGIRDDVGSQPAQDGERLSACLPADRNNKERPVCVHGVETHRLEGPMPPNWRVGEIRGFI